jgi:hypothetical protein
VVVFVREERHFSSVLSRFVYRYVMKTSTYGSKEEEKLHLVGKKIFPISTLLSKQGSQMSCNYTVRFV